MFTAHKSLEEINRYLEEKGVEGIDDICPVFIDAPGREEWCYDIAATGDWKHTHLYLKWLMEQIGYVRMFEQEIYVPEYEGSDYGESVHRYIWKMAADMLKLKYEPAEK